MKGWRTLGLAVIVAVGGVLQGADWTTIVSDPQTAGWIAAGIATVFGILRMFTNTAIGKSS